MEDLRAFFEMGGYARFVWPAYLITALVMIGLLAHVLLTLRRNEMELARLRDARRNPGAESGAETEAHVGTDA